MLRNHSHRVVQFAVLNLIFLLRTQEIKISAKISSFECDILSFENSITNRNFLLKRIKLMPEDMGYNSSALGKDLKSRS